MNNYKPSSPIEHDISNESYRSAHGDSATVLKGCLRSAKHAITPKPQTKTLQTGLRLHEYILEREKFVSTYQCGPNREDWPNAVDTKEEVVAAIKEINESRKPKLTITGSKAKLLELIAGDDTAHLENVQDVSKLSVDDLKDRIKYINSLPDRGLLPISGNAAELARTAKLHGWEGDHWPSVVAYQREQAEKQGLTMLDYDEYTKYNDMYRSLMDHLTEGAQREKQHNEYADPRDKRFVFQWLIYAFSTSGVMETELSMFGKDDKCRMDMMFKAGDSWFAFDVKKTVDASDEGFGKQAARYHYDLQAAHYSAVSEEVERPLETFGFIAIEDVPPYAVNIHLPNAEFMENGEKKRLYAKKQLKEYRESDTVCAYSPEAKELVMPAWAFYGPWND